MRTTLIKSLTLDNPKLYVTVNGERRLFAECTAVIELYENRQTIAMLGAHNGVKKTYYAKLICSDMDYMRDFDDDSLRSVSCFLMSSEVQRKDGVFEKLNIDNISLLEFEPDDDWVFELRLTTEFRAKIMNY